MRITVFTPTYNRGYIINKLYESLMRQTFRDFEWIIIDDGSSDNTEQIINTFKKKCSFPLTYIKVKNGGKHRAVNKGVRMAKGELFFIVDSDDCLVDDSLEIVDSVEKTIKDKEKFAGICGLRGYSNEKMVGTSFDGKTIDITSLERKKYKIFGDKAEVFYTEILKKYPFPEIENENFMTECVVWDKIAFDGYKLRFFNKKIYICDYLPDGLSHNSKKLFLDNPKGYGLYLYQCAKFGKITGLEKWNKFLQYYYFFRKKMSFIQMSKNLNMNAFSFYLRIFGLKLFYKLYDK